jgi:hypothetical protein
MSEGEAALLLGEAVVPVQMLGEYLEEVLYHVEQSWCSRQWHDDVGVAREFVRVRERLSATA